MLEKYTRGGRIQGMQAIFVLNYLKAKSLFGTMLERYNTGGRIKDMHAIFVPNSLESKSLFGSMLENTLQT